MHLQGKASDETAAAFIVRMANTHPGQVGGACLLRTNAIPCLCRLLSLRLRIGKCCQRNEAQQRLRPAVAGGYLPSLPLCIDLWLR